ncbi:MAG: hypothetical protein HUK15_05300 [Bacteroidales bacterium]|nr:hypothetical protein [Bacteroidales bacterium]
MLFKWKWHILIVTVVSATLGIVFSAPFFIHPKFKSTAVVYPANLVCNSDESESEQMLEVLLSDDIKFQVIEKFDLYSHYGIEKGEKGSIAKIMDEYNGAVSVSKTVNDAIEITVSDEDPQLAADVAEAIIQFYDQKVLAMNSEKSKEIVEIYTKSLEYKQLLIDSLSNEIKTYSEKYGLIDKYAQVREYTQAINEGRNLAEAHSVIDNWKQYGAEFVRLDSLLCDAVRRYEKNVEIVEDARRDAEKIQTYSQVVSKPYAADKKYYPVRWIIALLSAIGGCLIAVVTLAVVEACRKKEDADAQD